MSYLAIDIGGTKTLLASFASKGKLNDSLKFETPAIYEEFLITLSEKISKMTSSKWSYCGVAIPGRVDRKNGVGIVFGNLAWKNVPIAANVKSLVKCPVVIENDANLAGLSEAKLVPEYRKVLYITVSTGIGGIFVVNGKMDTNTLDAEIGHILLEHEGKLMRWEEFASGKAIYTKFGVKARDIPESDFAKWYLIARNIAIGLIDMVAIYTPDVVIIGGGIGSHFDNFKDKLYEELKIYEHPLLTIPPVLKAKRAEEAVIYGCYELAKECYERNY